jgi:hypothetical protein
MHSLVLNYYSAIKIIYGYFQDQGSFDTVIFLQQVEAAYVQYAPNRHTVPLSRGDPLIAKVRDETRSVHVVPVVGKVAVGKSLLQTPGLPLTETFHLRCTIFH